jgi:hypothetical protein
MGNRVLEMDILSQIAPALLDGSWPRAATALPGCNGADDCDHNDLEYDSSNYFEI